MLLGSLLLSGIFVATSFATEWSLAPSLTMKGSYNDNLFLTPLPHDPTYGYWLSPAVEFAGKTEQLEVIGKAALDFVEYYGGEPNRFTNVNLPLTLRYRTETDEWGFNGGFVRDNTLMGELLTTGLVLRFTQRNQWTMNPSWTRVITEKLSFQGLFQFSDATYQNGVRFGLVDYQVFGGSGGFLYHATERDEIQLLGTYTNFHTTNASFGLRAMFPGAMLNVTHAFTETMKGTLYGGPRFITSTTNLGGVSQVTRDTIWVFGAVLNKRLENASLQLTLARDIFPSGFGLLVQTERIGMLASYDLTENLSVSLDNSAYLVSAASPLARGGTLSENRLFYTTPMVAWKLSEWWKLEISYSYRWRDADGLQEPAMSNSMMFMLTYFPTKFAMSN